ncbi:MAG: hypothetical protein R2704_10180 [Microthrixaceae bacterium]
MLAPNPDYVFRSNDNGTLQSMVRAGMGWAVMPSPGGRHQRPRHRGGSCWAASSSQARSGWCDARRTHAPAVDRLIELARQAFARLS